MSHCDFKNREKIAKIRPAPKPKPEIMYAPKGFIFQIEKIWTYVEFRQKVIQIKNFFSKIE